MSNVIADIEKPNGEVIRIQLNEFQGKDYLDLRIHYYGGDDDELRPTKKGVSISVDLYEELKEAILKAEEAIAEGASSGDESEEE